MASLLYETIRDLHTIEDSTEASDSVINDLLSRASRNLFILLDLDEKSQHVVLMTTAIFPEQKVIFHTRQQNPDPLYRPKESDITKLPINRSLSFSSEATYTNLCHYIDEKLDNLTSDNVHREIISILESRAERQPIRLKESYACLITRFSELILQLLQLQVDAESSVLQFLSKCYASELSYYLSVNKELEVLPSSDTENILHALDRIIDVPDATELFESMFSYSSESVHAVNFRSSDDSFNKLYFNFLQLSLLKLPEQFPHHSLANIKAMMAMYKKSIDADSLELGDSNIGDLKLKYVINFLCSSSARLGYKEYRDFMLNTIENCKHCNFPRDPEKKLVNESDSPLFYSNPPHQFESETPPELTEQFLIEEAKNLILGVTAVFENLRDANIDVNPLFPRCFRSYLISVLETMAEFANSNDHRYIRSTAATIDAVTSYSIKDGSLEDSGILSILQDLQMVEDFLVSPQHLQTLLMRETYLKYLETKTALARFFRKWNIKVLSFKQMELNSEEFNKITARRQFKQKMSKWYDRVSRYKQLHEHATIYSNKQLLIRYFNSKFIKPYLKLAADEFRGDIYVLSRYFRVWLSNLNVMNERKNAAINEVQKKFCLMYFRIISSAYRKRMENQVLAMQYRSHCLELQNIELQKNVILLWRVHLQRNYPKNVDVLRLFQEIDNRKRFYVLKKPFALWVVRKRLNQNSEAFKQIQRDLLLKTLLTQWIAASNLVNHEKIYAALQHLYIKSSIFANWRKDCQNYLRAEKLSRYRLLAHHFKQLQLATAERKLQSTQNFSIIDVFWKKWKLQCYVYDNQAFNAKNAFDCWKQKSYELNASYSDAEKVYELKKKKDCFDTWGRFCLVLEEIKNVADLNFQRNYFNRISRKLHTHRERERLADVHRIEFSNKLESKLMNSLLLIWIYKHKTLFETKTQRIILDFNKRVVEKNLLKVYFRALSRKKVAMENKKNKLEYQLRSLKINGSLLRNTFVQWVDATNVQYDKEVQADVFYFEKLSGKVWRTWVQRTARIVSLLNVQAESIQDRKDYDLVVTLLRQWYYKHAAVLSAKDSACKAFMEKRRRLNLKTMFDLWMYKHSTKHSEFADAYVEANSTFMSNSSPLAQKNASSKNVSRTSINKGDYNGSFFENESYFYTPKEVSFPFTPVKNRTSPTRLQETNQRIRLDRLDALTRRFRDANIREDSRSGALRSGAFPRLSPPKIRDKVLGGRPPAPVFSETSTDGASVGTTEPTTDDLVNGILDASSPTKAPLDDDDEPLLATAKSLQRIKPIVINYEDVPSELHYSTVNTLKDRLMAQVSPRRLNQN